MALLAVTKACMGNSGCTGAICSPEILQVVFSEKHVTQFQIEHHVFNVQLSFVFDLVLFLRLPLPLPLISSASGMERGEVFYGPTDWLGSRDPMTPYDTRMAHQLGLDD